MRDAWRNLLDAVTDKHVALTPTLAYDIVDVGRQVLSDYSVLIHKRIVDAFHAKDVAGVDLQGFYVLGSSGAQLRVRGSGSVAGSGTVADVQDTTIDGTASADVTVGVRVARDEDRRLRSAELEQLTPQRLVRTIDGGW